MEWVTCESSRCESSRHKQLQGCMFAGASSPCLIKHSVWRAFTTMMQAHLVLYRDQMVVYAHDYGLTRSIVGVACCR